MILTKSGLYFKALFWGAPRPRITLNSSQRSKSGQRAIAFLLKSFLRSESSLKGTGRVMDGKLTSAQAIYKDSIDMQIFRNILNVFMSLFLLSFILINLSRLAQYFLH
ncbi:MAG: hypothetical protein AAF327_14960 [Cyanobacteria bacterium P01_A01_bin.37]